ncbi:SDR family oxidoreductase [Actinomadura flavalba]|uniref:SDR family oxidoreductase n=1 Tax=Actinomadura flavalba TaxID=1120938 RepID=UPI0004762D71|nr:SDR family oxidoreductase [Actinomadura flavalba]
MNIVIAGGHGQIALRLARLLSGRGDTVRSLIRKPEQADAIRATGAQPVVLDLENASPEEVAERLGGADAAVFAAGAGPRSGVERKDTVDRGASVLLADAAGRAGVRTFVQISAMGVDQPPAPDAGEQWAAYVRAKHAAEEDLKARDLDWIIVRPGRLTDERGTGKITLGEPDVGYGEVTRDDVAATVAALLSASGAEHRTLDLINGETRITDAVAAL